MSDSVSNGKWLERSVLIALAIVVMSLAGLGYSSIKGDTDQIKKMQEKDRTEIMALLKDTTIKVDKVCQEVQKHDSWLRVPFDQRRRSFLGKDDYTQ